MGHHDLHHHGHDLAHEVGAVLHLGTVELAVPRGAAVHQLVAQGVDALEDQRQQFGRVALGQQDGGFALAGGQAFLPGGGIDFAALEAPERFKDIGVVQQDADGAAEAVPHQIVEPPVRVQPMQLVQKGAKAVLLGQALLGRNVLRIGGVEGNPQEDAAGVGVVALGRALQPAEGAVHAQVQPGGQAVARGTVAVFECGVDGLHRPLLGGWGAA